MSASGVKTRSGEPEGGAMLDELNADLADRFHVIQNYFRIFTSQKNAI